MTGSVEPLLNLDDPELEWKRFERFCLDLAKALPDVQDAHFYGVQGDEQEGIDIHADLVDGRVRTIQCRRVAKFGKTDVDATIRETTYSADEHAIWIASKLTAQGRKAVDAAPRWDAWDIEQISSAVRALPREVGRWLVEDHLGQAERRRVLGPEAELALARADAWFRRTDGNPRLLQTNQPLEGRDEELAALRADIQDRSVAVVILPGRGGVGKTRLLRALAEALPDRRILILREGVDVGATLGVELPMAPFDALIDDAHRRDDLRSVLATIFSRDEFETVVLATRPHRLEPLRDMVASLGLRHAAIHVLDPLRSLEDEAARRVAEHELDADNIGVAGRLADLTRDAPAILVLASQLISSGEVDPDTLIASPTLRREVLSRFQDERLGRIADDVSPDLASAFLSLVAAVQPVDLTAPRMTTWLAEQLDTDESSLATAAQALTDAGLLVGPRRARVAPDILADHLLHQQTIDVRGEPTARPRELLESVPMEMLGQLMSNLAELDWRLGRAGEPRILDEACRILEHRLVAMPAWSRERHLAQLGGSAAFLAPWVVQLARQLIDHPADDEELFVGHVVTDVDARRELVRMLAQAGLNPDCTEASVRLLWELGADLEPQPSRHGGDPLDEARQIADYRRPLHYAETLVAVVEDLARNPNEGEAHGRLPVELLAGVAGREGTTTEAASKTAIRLGSYFVSAEATRDFRTRLRSLLVELSLGGGDRLGPAAAETLGEMLRQPHGYFGRSVPEEALKQWRPEQLALVADMDSVLSRTDDPLVAREIRHAVAWHADHSAIRGVKTAVRRLLRAHEPSLDERLADALTHSLARFAEHKQVERARAALTRELRREDSTVDRLLDRLDAAIERLQRARPKEHVDPGPVLAALSSDSEWAIAASQILVAEPRRPTAVGVGVLLSNTLTCHPEATRELLGTLADSEDPLLRRFAADHISRMAWFPDPAANERAVALQLAGDGDPVVVQFVVLAAHRAASEDPHLAADIVSNVRDLSIPQLAEDVCMVLSHPLPLTGQQWQSLLDLLLACPRLDYWYDRALVERASASWRQVFDHLLARIDEGADDYRYDALPFDGISGDLLRERPTERHAALDELVGKLAEAPHGRRSMDMPLLFWSIAGDGDAALASIARALTLDSGHRDAAETMISAAPRHLFLDNPVWVEERLDASPPGAALDELSGAVYAAMTSGIKQGTPGQPFPEDVELEKRARQHADASRAGSRARSFWLRVADATAAEIARQIDEDSDEEDD